MMRQGPQTVGAELHRHQTLPSQMETGLFASVEKSERGEVSHDFSQE